MHASNTSLFHRFVDLLSSYASPVESPFSFKIDCKININLICTSEKKTHKNHDNYACIMVK